MPTVVLSQPTSVPSNSHCNHEVFSFGQYLTVLGYGFRISDPGLVLGRVNCDSHAIPIKVPHINGRPIALHAGINRIITVAVSLGRGSFAILQCNTSLQTIYNNTNSAAMPSLISPNIHVSCQAQHGAKKKLDHATSGIYICPLLLSKKA
jgi:hypothetical protein